MRAVLVLALLSAPPPAMLETRDAASEYTLIVSSSNPVKSIKRRELARIFLRKVTRWEDGSSVSPVDQSARSVVRSAFTRDVMRVEGLGQLSGVVNYWQQQVYSGTGAPPPIKDGDGDVVSFVAANKGAIGYVTAGTNLDGVRVLKLEE